MTTSLPPDVALFHMDAKVFQRSAGRSAVAAAAYRSASRLVDERIGQEFDYTKKHKLDAFILAPAGAPAWVFDRAELWNRAEAVEVRRNAVVAREVEVSIPRDIPQSQWRAFAEEICQPYIAAGAVCDVAIHCPKAADGEAQPHIHIMLTTRTLDASTPTAFARGKNDTLAGIFESGGRRGGTKGEALIRERERIAGIMNGFLERAGSPRRASHLSNRERGLEDREPEPTIGEQRMAKVKRQKRHDRRTALVDRMRQTRVLENEITATEEEIMRTNPKFQTLNGIKPRRRQDFKAKLLQERFPDIRLAGLADQLHQVDVRDPRTAKIRMRDGGWVEVDSTGRIIRTYGAAGSADELAARLQEAGYGEHIERLEETQRLRRSDAPAREQLPAAEAESLADRWRARGFYQVNEAPDGCWITIGSCKIQDLGSELRVHGKPTNEACRALIEKAAQEWDSEVEIFGTREFKDAAWTEAQRQGVTVYDQATGQPYEPSPDVRKSYEADLARNATHTNDMGAIRREKSIALLLREAAAGDKEALAKLESNEPELDAFIRLHLDDDQRAGLAGKPEADIAESLAHFRAYGQEARRKEAATAAAGQEHRAPDFEPDSRVVDLDIHRALKIAEGDDFEDIGLTEHDHLRTPT